jgi:O-antigen/teichoic acid export membrane protein
MAIEPTNLLSGTRAGGANAAAQPPRSLGRGRLYYFFANLVSQVFSLLRYVLLARLLGPEQLGIAATLTITSSFFDLISNTGSDRFIIQDRFGDQPRVQNFVQLTDVARGVLIAICLATFSTPIADFFHSPRLAIALRMLAVVPVILGFVHLDVRRFQREHDFRGESICLLTSEAVGLAAMVSAAWFTHDFTAVLFGLVARAVAAVACSHLLAERPYALGWASDHVARFIAFAAPLMINGALLFIFMQGDRAIIGKLLNPKILGVYSAIMLLGYYPVTMIAGFFQKLYLPVIAEQRDKMQQRNALSNRFGGEALLLSIVFAVGFTIAAPFFVPMLFGQRYDQPIFVLSLIGILQATRFLLNWPTTVALALGSTTTVMFSNLAHLVSFVAAIVGERMVGGLIGVVGGYLIGEIFAFTVALVLMNRNMACPWHANFDRFSVFVATCSLILSTTAGVQARFWPASSLSCLMLLGLIVWTGKRESAVLRNGLTMARGMILHRTGPGKT